VAGRDTPTTRARLQQLADAFGWSGRIVTVPDERLRDPLGLEQLKNVPGYVAPPDLRQNVVMDSTRIREELGYTEMVPLGEGLRRTIEWLLVNPPPDYDSDYEDEDAVLASLWDPADPVSLH
jgi:nucleoside-diphosphate-sugar epimerase